MRILITGGAGFIGSTLAVSCQREIEGARVCAFDNLRRRGSETALDRLRSAGVDFVHGDVRCPDDLRQVPSFDVLVECSAEPSVNAGTESDPSYVIHTNLVGTVHCLEAARTRGAAMIFLSTSRVYPIDALRALPLERRGDRLEVKRGASGAGWSDHGITAEFPLDGHRSMYGATKLAAELLIAEYRALHGLRAIVNRCGVVAGPWQMGKVDQGFIALWAARHLCGVSLAYHGFGGEGLQVRDVLHVDDLVDLIKIQISSLQQHDGAVFNVGGGLDRSVSLVELTRECHARAGQQVPIGRDPETSRVDVPYYVTDNDAVTAATGWEPQRSTDVLLNDVFDWLRAYRSSPWLSH